MTDPAAKPKPADIATTVKAPDGSEVLADYREATPNDLEHQTGNPGHRGLNRNTGYAMNPAPNDVDPALSPVSINEPPGSQVVSPPTDPSAPIDQAAAKPAPKPLPSDAELHEMTRAELDTLAKKRGIDTLDEATKADVIARLKKG